MVVRRCGGRPYHDPSYPWLIPGLRDVFTRGSTELWWLWVAMGIASLAVLVYSGSQFFIGAWEALKHRSANMHTLIAIGTGTAWIYSSVALLFPQIFPSADMTDVYYDVTVVVTALVVLGMAMEVKARGRASEAIEKLIGLAPRWACSGVRSSWRPRDEQPVVNPESQLSAGAGALLRRVWRWHSGRGGPRSPPRRRHALVQVRRLLGAIQRGFPPVSDRPPGRVLRRPPGISSHPSGMKAVLEVPTVRRVGPAGTINVGVRAVRTLATVASGAVAAVSGIAPHVLHHVGPLAGTAVLAGAGGTVLFGVAGFALSIPMLLRLRRRFGTWAAPAVASVIFTGTYLFSALVVGPALTADGPAVEAPAATPSPIDHADHH